MHSRPQSVIVATILLVLLSLFDFSWPWMLLFPGAEQPPAFVIYTDLVLGIVGLVVAVGLWMMKAWSYLATIIVCVAQPFFGSAGDSLRTNHWNTSPQRSAGGSGTPHHCAGNASLLPACFRGCSPTFARTVSPVSENEPSRQFMNRGNGSP